MNKKNIAIIRGYGAVLKNQKKTFEFITKIKGKVDVYVISEEKLYTSNDISMGYLKSIGNCIPIKVVCLDSNNIDQFLNDYINKFSLIIQQGMHSPLSLLINKYAKQNQVVSIDALQAHDYYDVFFLKDKRNLLRNLRAVYNVIFNKSNRFLYKYIFNKDLELFFFIIRNFKWQGFRFIDEEIPEIYRFDHCFLRGERQHELYCRMGYNKDSLSVYGNYELTLLERELPTYKVDKKNKFIIYIDSQLADLYNFSIDLDLLFYEINRLGFEVLFYPHPSTEVDRLTYQNASILEKGCIGDYIDNASLVVGHISNMLDIIVYKKKKLCFIYGEKMYETVHYKWQETRSQMLGVKNICLGNNKSLLEEVNTLINSEINEELYGLFLKKYCGDYDVHKKGTDNIFLDVIDEKFNGLN